MTENSRETPNTLSLIVRAVASVSTSYVVRNLMISQMTPPVTTSEKVRAVIGVFTLSSMVAYKADQYAGHSIDSYMRLGKDIKETIQDIEIQTRPDSE